MTPRSVKNTLHKKKAAHVVNKPSKSHLFFTPPQIPKSSEIIEEKAAASCKKTAGGPIFCLFYLVARPHFGPTEEAKDMRQLKRAR